MRIAHRLLFLATLPVAAFLTSCETGSGVSGGSYHVVAHRPHDPSKVEVKLSLATQNLYVMEGDRLLMAAQGNVGKPDAPTPTGNYTIYSKEKQRRRQSEPDRGYPMAYWCEFKPAYGFHEGFVHPYPHTHGCVRLHKRSRGPSFRADQDRHASPYRELAAGRQGIWQPGPADSIRAETPIRRARS